MMLNRFIATRMQYIGYVTGICSFVHLPLHQQHVVENYPPYSPSITTHEYLTSVPLTPFTDVQSRTLVDWFLQKRMQNLLMWTDADVKMSASARLWSNLLYALSHPHWSLFCNHQLTHLITNSTFQCATPHFLLLFVFLISSIHHHHPALLHHHTLIMDRLLTFPVAFSTHLKTFLFSKSLHGNRSLAEADLELWPLVVWQSLVV